MPEPHRNAETVPEGRRRCPICGESMIVEKKSGISIDVCPDHGIWLDRGELPAIIRAVRQRERRLRTRAVREARRSGKVSGSMFGFWSLIFD